MKLLFYLILVTVSFVKGEKCFVPMICNNIPTWARISMNIKNETCGNQIKQLEEKADRMIIAFNEMFDELENLENMKSTTTPVIMYNARGTLADSFENDDRDNVKLTTQVSDTSTTKPVPIHGVKTTDDVTTSRLGKTNNVTHGMKTTDDVTTPELTTSVAITPELTTNPNHNDCSTIDKNDAPLQKSATGGVFTINPGGTGQLNVYCDLTTDGGKWTVFQRRQDGRVDFVSRNWEDYVKGFGDLINEYWFGLEILHQLTTKGEFELRIDLEDWDGNKRYAKYKNFHIGSAATKYQLNIGSYQGDVWDSLSVHNGMKFSTRDQDNDLDRVNCATDYNSGGWWFQHCFGVDLNGKYNNQGPISEYGKGIIWKDWKGWYYSLKSTEMKFRPMV